MLSRGSSVQASERAVCGGNRALDTSCWRGGVSRTRFLALCFLGSEQRGRDGGAVRGQAPGRGPSEPGVGRRPRLGPPVRAQIASPTHLAEVTGRRGDLPTSARPRQFPRTSQTCPRLSGPDSLPPPSTSTVASTPPPALAGWPPPPHKWCPEPLLPPGSWPAAPRPSCSVPSP